MKKRYLVVNELRPEFVEAYRKFHMEMHLSEWQPQLKVLEDAGAEECMVYLYNNLAIMIYVCDDIDESYDTLGKNPVRDSWTQLMTPMFANTPKFDGTAKAAYCEKIFDMKQQLHGELNQF